MSLIGDRRLPSQLLVGLEGSGCGRLGGGGPSGRLSDPFRLSTSSIRVPPLPAGVLPTVHQGSRLNPGASKPSSEGGSRTSPSVSWFLQPSVPRPEGFGVVASHHRSVDPEQLRHLVSLPHGDSTVSPSFHPSGRLDDLPGPAGRLPAGSCSSRNTSLPSIRGARKGVPVQGPLFRSDDRAPSLHEDYGSRFRHPSQVWGQDASLPGRLAHPGLFGASLFTVEGQAPDSMYRTWHPGQPHEIVSSSHSITSVSRHGDSVSAFHSSTYSSTSQQSTSSDRGVLVHPVSPSVPLASASGPLVIPHAPRPWRDALDEVAPDLPQGSVGFPRRPVSGLLVPSLSRGSSLVGSSGATAGGGESLSLPIPDIIFFSDASDVGWGALVGEHHASDLWSPLQAALSINLRELLAVQYGLLALEHLLVGRSVALFCDNTTTVPYLRRSGGTFSSTLNATAREILLWAETNRVRLLPQFIMGSSNVTADILSRPNQVIGSEWTLHQEVVDHLVHKWPAVIDHFVTSLATRLPVYFSPTSDSRAAGTDALLQPWDNLKAYAFPPIAIIRRVLVKLRSSRNCESTLITPFWPQRDWFPDLLELLSDLPIALPRRKDLLRQPHFHCFHQNLPMHQLTAWRLSSDSPVRPASLLRWLDNLSSVEDSPHA